MKIVSCLKDVPGRETRYELNPDRRWINQAHVTFEANECDEYALEEALKLKEKHGGEVTILTLGPERSEKVMRKGLAMGADRGIHILDPEGRAGSPFLTASALAKALEGEDFDLLLAGTQSDDYSYAQTGIMLAERLGLPHATIVMEIEADPSTGRVKALREMESGWFEWVEMPMPAVLAVQAGIAQIRYASLKGIMQARKKEIRRIPLSDLSISLEAPRIEILELYFPREEKKAEMLEGSPEAVAAVLIDKLKKEARVLSD